jgi:serine/threonine protein kinase
MIDTHYRPTVALVPKDGAPQPSPATPPNHEALRPGVHLDEFEVIRVLGSGGFGIVYLALDKILLRYVAIKEYLPTALAGRGEGWKVSVRSTPQAETFALGLDSFFNEARMLASFDHPSLVKVHRFWKANGTAYMAMQYYPGQTLRDARSAMTTPPDEAWLRAFIDPLLGALEVLHKQGVYHRDIAPDNILLLPDGHPVLLDFGSARRVIGDLTQSLTAVLKPNFSPIEQYADEAGMRQGAWTDLYALGATVHFTLTGKTPTPAVMRVVRDVLPALSATESAGYSGLSARFLSAVDWLTAVSPQDRPQSVESFRLALEGKLVPPTPTPRHEPIAKSLQGAEKYEGTILEFAPTRAQRPVDSFPATVMSGPSSPVPSIHGNEALGKISAPATRKWRHIATVGWVALVAGVLGVGWVGLTMTSGSTLQSAAVGVPAPVPAASLPAQPSLAPAVAPQVAAPPNPQPPSALDAGVPRSASPQTIPTTVKAQPVVTRAFRARPTSAIQPMDKNPPPATEPTASSHKDRPIETLPLPTAAVTHSPSDICGPLNFFARAACFRHECQSPRWQSDPQCAEAKNVQNSQQNRGQL